MNSGERFLAFAYSLERSSMKRTGYRASRGTSAIWIRAHRITIGMGPMLSVDLPTSFQRSCAPGIRKK